MTTSKTNVLQDGGASNAVLAIRRLEENTNKTVDDVAKGQGVRIAVLGDSMSAQSTIYADMWPTKLQTLLTQNGVSCSIRTFSVNAHSFFRLNTLPVYGAKTCVEELLEYTPDVVIVVCGHNDAVSPVDGRTVPQIQADALETFATLRAGLPKAEIYYGSQLAYDNVHFTPATLKNKGAAPLYMEKKSSGILQDLYSPDILDDALGATKRTEHANWELLDNEIKGAITTATSINGSFTLDAWRVARLGFLSCDGLHSTGIGHELLASSIIKGLTFVSAAFISKLADQLVVEWTDLDAMFNALLVTDGVDAYNPVTPLDLTALTSIYSLTDRTHLTTWYQPFKWDFSFFPTTVVAASDFSGLFRWELLGAEPFTAVENSVNGGAFSPATHSDGTPIVTNQHGNAADQNTVGTIGLPTGSYAFIFKAGNIVTSTITITVL